ncbi:MAG: desulfoferrodoxin [Spirochaetes bacterium]|nr:desulfoferrodoxin [Spirochaetota bacterium]
MEKLQVYKCEVCGNIVQLLHAGGGELVCCNQPMNLLKEKTEDQGQEKHVPVIEATDNGIKVKVGSVPHPMEEKHFIQWIEVVTDGKSYKEFLKPGKSAEALFCVKKDKVLMVREYCNIHGFWKTK